MKSLNQFLFCLFFTASLLSFSQTSINDFKYVSVPESYSFLKSKDQYQLNSLTIFLFEKNNFKVLNSFQNYPSDLSQNSCLLLKSDVISIKGFLKTKLQLVLTDCKDNIVFSSEIGKSKLKDFKKAFHQALRNVFMSVGDLNYSYSGAIPYSTKSSVANVAAEIKENQVLGSTVPIAPEASTTSMSELDLKAVAVVVPPTPPIIVPQISSIENTAVSVLIVKPTNSGYDFVDGITKKVMYSAQATLFENVYIIEGQSGIMYKRGSAWVREYYEQNKTIIEALNVRP
jgi:hypothetical protein